MAESPPWPPLPSTSLSTTGTTAASNWPSMPLKVGEFSNESRIPMVRPFHATSNAGSNSDRLSGDPSSRDGGRRLASQGSHRLELLDNEGFGKPGAGPFLKRRQRH